MVKLRLAVGHGLGLFALGAKPPHPGPHSREVLRRLPVVSLISLAGGIVPPFRGALGVRLALPHPLSFGVTRIESLLYGMMAVPIVLMIAFWLKPRLAS